MHHRFHAFSAEDLFLVGLGFDMAGAYLVSRGLVRPVPKLAASGGTIWALERPRVPDAVEDHFRGIVGLVVLVLGFAVQATGYAITVSKGRLHFQSGAKQALIGLGLALVAAASVPLLERLVRPRYRIASSSRWRGSTPALTAFAPSPSRTFFARTARSCTRRNSATRTTSHTADGSSRSRLSRTGPQQTRMVAATKV